MKDLFTVAATLFFFSASSGFGGLVAVANMLMGNSLGSYLSELVSFDSLTVTQMDDILNIADNTTSSDRFDMFETEESKDELRNYLYAEVSASNMEEYTAEMIASITSLGALYPTEQLDLVGFEGPAESNYDDNGNLEFLARIRPRPTNINNNIYTGIWGVTKGEREYALLSSSWGFEIIDVTDPRDPVKVQGVEMSGGHVWRDVATHTASDGKVYAYVAAQDQDTKNTQSHLFVFDLSELSGDIDEPDGANSDPIQPGFNGYLDRDQNGLGHTVNVAGGFLFLNSANQRRGCVVFDLSNPMIPNEIFSHWGNGKQCHDSSLWENVNVDGQLKTLWIVSEGSGMAETIMDFTDVISTTTQEPPELSTTPLQNGIYAHSNALSEDKRFLFQFDENNKGDIYVYDISNVYQPRIINRFQYSEEDTSNAMPHNGHIKGKYLHVAYYEAGLRTFDISNPYVIREVGKIETYRDPQQTGTNVRQIQGNYRGAWNSFVGLSSGNILVTDMFSGLFIVKANSPYPEPNAPTLSAVRNVNNGVTLTWNRVPNARAYSVERSIGGQSFVVVAEFLTTTSYFDNTVRDTNASYKVKAVNGEGTGVSATVESAVLTASPTKAPTNQPTPRPSPLPTPNPTSPPSRAPTPQPSPNPTSLEDDLPIPVPTTSAPTRDVLYSGAFGCLRNNDPQSTQCLPPVFDKERAVNCCQGQGESLTCDRSDCPVATSFFDATAKCENKGMRLCSTQELESDACCSKGCNFDSRVGWTTDICAPQTPAPTSPPPTPPPTPQPTGGTDELPGTPYPTFEATGSLQSMAEPL